MVLRRLLVLGPQLRRSSRPRIRLSAASVVVAGALALCAPFASAHDGLEERIAGVTAQLAENPTDAALLVRRADLYRQARRWKQAFADLDRAERADPAPPAAGLVRAHVLLDSHDWRSAAEAATQFLARQPGNADALIVRGRARARIGQARSAATDFTHALEELPLPDVYSERARALAGLGGTGLEEALRGLDEGISRLGPVASLELEAVDLDLRLRRYDAALVRLDRVSAQAQRKETWQARRGEVLEQAGRLDQARAAYGEAMDSARTQPPHIRETRSSAALIERLTAAIERLDVNITTASHGLKRNP